MYTTVATVTPREAKEWLETKNFHNNRPMSEATVRKYSQEMKAGRWKVNGESIIFSASGRLLNGQHRLKACIMANVPFTTVLVKGADDDTFDTIDDGKSRNLGDVLAIRGEHGAYALASGLRFVWEYGSGQFLSHGGSRKIISTKQLLEKLLDKHQGLRASAKLCKALEKKPGGLLLPPSLSIGLHYLFSLVHAEKADEFFSSFQSGQHLGADSPILLLRAKLIAGSKEATAIRREAMYTYTVMSWNAYVEAKPLKRMVYAAGSKMVEIAGLPVDLMKGLLD